MKIKYISIILFLLLNCPIKGQYHNYKLISNDEKQVLNDLCYTLIDSTRLMVISPLIDIPINSLNLTDSMASEFEKKYGFDISKFECLPGDTLFIKQNPKMCGHYLFVNGGFKLFKDSFLIKDNKYFQVLQIDTLIKYNKILESDKRNGFQNENPLLKFVKNTYKGRSHRICRFNKIVFSRDKKYALVDYSIYCGNWCSDGATVLMEKKGEQWVIIDKLTVKFS